ncbi:S phase cyclin A-associated protein in the endoplasmic reticulum [Acropora cervicornis]|uniref:S phase cyclin A-associated protein in the endoplasmic reticulum n=1 Tax=Acropora cervicornis TaxID=6130 RepID=A0AAD9UYB9_ACRCE|nr:S phase cyclin A-associated protein in the endoplasmic reticulum [Acropora cervicornis]
MSSHVQDGSGRKKRSPRSTTCSSRPSESHNSEKNQHRENSSGRRNNSGKHQQKNIHRTNSHDHVRKLVEQEGRAARNLVTWSVPVTDPDEEGKKSKPKVVGKRRTSTPEKSGSSEREGSPAQKGRTKSPGRSRSGSRKLSGSFSGKKNDLRTRYWSYLFDNLKRAVDEIYGTCEADESIVECQEVIMMLDQCRRDFSALIDRINVQNAFEKADYKDRPTSLAWEVRKSSPGKALFSSASVLQQPSLDRSSTSPVRSLDFNPQSAISTEPSVNQSGAPAPLLSWADKVRGTTSVGSSVAAVAISTVSISRPISNAISDAKNSNSPENAGNCDANGMDDEEGWETVHRGRKVHSNNSRKGNKVSHANELSGREQVALNHSSPEKSANVEKCNGDVSESPVVKDFGSEKTSTSPNAVDESSLENLDRDAVDNSLEEQASLSDIEHEKALSAATEQEESLSRQIEEYQDQMIASVIEHEEILTKEIAEEKELVTAINGESESPISDIERKEESENGENDSLNCSATTNGDGNVLSNSESPLTWEEMIAKYDENLFSPLEEVIRIHEEKQVQKARELKDDLIQQRQQHLDEKQRRAEQQRLLVIQEIVRKAQEEDAKGHEARLQDIQEERQRKKEEQQAKEAAALQAETTRRHEQVLEQVKEKAAGVSRHSTQDEVPAVTPYDQKKICTLCNVQIVSEVYLLSHLRGKIHQQALSETQKGTFEDKDTISLQYIKDMSSDKADEAEKAEQERQKALRKKATKLRTRMAAKGREYENNLSNSTPQRKESSKRSRFQKIAKDLNRQLQSQGSGPWMPNVVASLERSLGELSRILESKVSKISTFQTLCSVARVMSLSCDTCLDNCRYMVLTNKLSTVVDLLVYQMKSGSTPQATPEGTPKKSAEKEPGSVGSNILLSDPLATALLNVLAVVVKCFATAPHEGKEDGALVQRIIDLIGYVVCSGVVDDIRSKNIFDTKKEDVTEFVNTFKQTELVEMLSFLYAILMNTGSVQSPTPTLPEVTISLTTEALCTLNFMATVDLSVLQASLGAEGVSLEFRHIISHLLCVCSDGKNEDLLHEVILIVGYFTVLNYDNQVFVQTGRPPTLLQHLCLLPFQYFSDPRLRSVLFPTLISACYENEENKRIIEQEVSCALLENYVEEQLLDLQHGRFLPSQSSRCAAGIEVSRRFALANRFPFAKWEQARKFLLGS